MTTCRRKKRSSRKRPAATSAFEIAVRRGDDAHVDLDRSRPRRRAGSRPPGARAGASPASSGEISPISSRKSVPPLASSKRPRFAPLAPVNAPRSWPKSSLSRSDSGSAAQLTATNGFVARGALRVDGARDELLARAALADDEHRRRRRRDLRDRLVDGDHRRRAADDLRVGGARRASRRPARRSARACAARSPRRPCA